MARNGFNDTYVTSRYKAYDPQGNYRGPAVITHDKKREMEAKGWTFTRTTLTESGGDRSGS
jgi:hypothetical protein